MTVLHEITDAVAQGKQFGPALHQRNAVHAETGLQRCHLEQLVQHHTRIGVTFHVHHYAHALLVRLVIDVADAFNLLVVHHLGNALDHLGLVHTVWNLSDNNLVVLFTAFNLGLRAHNHTSAPGLIGILDALHAHDVGAGGEIGALHIGHQVRARKPGIVHKSHTGVYHLSQIVGGNVGGHAHGNTGGSVHEQVGYAGGHHRGLAQGVIKVVGHVHGFLVQVFHHGLAHQAQAGLGVTHGGRAVTVHRTEVSLSVHQRVAHGPLLRHAHQGSVHTAVTVGMIFTQHLTHDTCALLAWPAMQVPQFLHPEENAAVHRLETVSHIRQRTGHNHAHRIVDVAFSHFVLDVYLNDSFLIFHL